MRLLRKCPAEDIPFVKRRYAIKIQTDKIKAEILKQKNVKKVNRINYLLDEERYEIAAGQGYGLDEESSEFDSDLEKS